jgi:lipid-A-disaccharide synthase-like uncharacterized protein
MLSHALSWITLDRTWLAIGLIGQGLFFSRFLIQWWESEREGRSIIPVAFWYFSVGGGVVLLAYSIHKLDPVFILGQGVGLFVYFRNLFLIFRERAALKAAAGSA